ARREFNIPGITFGGRYDGSPVIIADGTPLPEDASNAYVPTASPGGRPPHIWLEDGRSLFDVFGGEWTLLQLGGDAAGAEPFCKAAQASGVQLQVVRLVSPAAHSAYEADLTLIRPDQIVAWRGSGPVHDCEQIWMRLLGYPMPERT